MALALQALALVGETVYAGSVVAFAVLMLFRARLGPSERVVRVFQAWATGQGLAMGALILGNAGLYYLRRGAFEWSFDTPAAVATAVQHGLFVALWVSSFHLEIWTLDPCRLLDKDDAVSDRAAYEKAAGRVTLQLVLNVALLALCAGLGLFIETL